MNKEQIDSFPCLPGKPTSEHLHSTHYPFFKKKLVVMRGLPGMAKSTIADFIRENIGSLSVVVCSADHFFTDKDGNYNWYPQGISQAHQECQENARKAMEIGILTVIVDNTNVQRSEFSKYTRWAEEYGYGIVEITVGNLDVDKAVERNSHNVPKKSIQRMAERLARSWKVR